MFETIPKFGSYLENVTIFTYPISLFLGFLAGMTALTCCFPIVPAVAGFIGGQEINKKRLILIPVFIMLGSAITLVILGISVSVIGLTLQTSLGQYWNYLLGIICITVGLFSLGIVRIPLSIKASQIRYKGFWAPFLFGLTAGGIMSCGSVCCFPVLPIVLTYAAIQGRPLHGALILGTFALGQSLPLFGIGIFSSFLKNLAEKWSFYIRRIAGVLLLVVGIYFIFFRGGVF